MEELLVDFPVQQELFSKIRRKNVSLEDQTLVKERLGNDVDAPLCNWLHIYKFVNL